MHTKQHHPAKTLYLRIAAAKQRLMDTRVLAKIFNALNLAFENFIAAELNLVYAKIKPGLKKEIKRFGTETKMLLTGINVNSLTLSIQVDTEPEKMPYRSLKEVVELKEKMFGLFIQTVFRPNLFDPDFVLQLSGRYTAKERIGIFKPIFDNLIGQEFVVYFRNDEDKTDENWPENPDKEPISLLIPEAVKQDKQVESYYQYVKTGEINDLFGKRSRYEKVLIKENPKHDLYPYQLQKISLKNKTYHFSRQLTASVTVKNGLYQLQLPELLLSATGENRIGAEKAFNDALAAQIRQLEKGQSNSPKEKAALAKLQSLLLED
ncbi:MAG: hypothetical protein ACRYFL_12880 [Janthinobacterium lividum]